MFSNIAQSTSRPELCMLRNLKWFSPFRSLQLLPIWSLQQLELQNVTTISWVSSNFIPIEGHNLFCICVFDPIKAHDFVFVYFVLVLLYMCTCSRVLVIALVEKCHNSHLSIVQFALNNLKCKLGIISNSREKLSLLWKLCYVFNGCIISRNKLCE